MPRKSTTRNAPGTGNIRLRPDGRWEARYCAGRDPRSGAIIRRSIYGQTQAEVRKRLQQISVSIEDGTYIAPSKMTVAQWLQEWQENYLGNVKDSTREQYAANIKNNIVPYISAVLLIDLAPHMIQHLYNNLQKPHCIPGGKGKKIKRPPVSPKTIKNVHGTLHKALKQALLLGYIKSNPADAVVLPRVEKHEVNFLHDESIPALLEAVKGDRFESVYRVALFTGLRQGEILGLTWDAVDFEAGVLRIDKQLQGFITGSEYSLVSTKNGRTRRIKVAPYVLDILRQERQTQRLNRLKACAAWSNDLDLVFTDPLGRPLSRRTLYTNFKKLVASIGLPETRFHDLRHTFAMLSLQNGDDVKTVQEAVGHATAAFTLDVYGHVSQRMKQESANRMQAYIESLSVT